MLDSRKYLRVPYHTEFSAWLIPNSHLCGWLRNKHLFGYTTDEYYAQLPGWVPAVVHSEIYGGCLWLLRSDLVWVDSLIYEDIQALVATYALGGEEPTRALALAMGLPNHTAYDR